MILLPTMTHQKTKILLSSADTFYLARIPYILQVTFFLGQFTYKTHRFSLSVWHFLLLNAPPLMFARTTDFLRGNPVIIDRNPPILLLKNTFNGVLSSSTTSTTPPCQFVRTTDFLFSKSQVSLIGNHPSG